MTQKHAPSTTDPSSLQGVVGFRRTPPEVDTWLGDEGEPVPPRQAQQPVLILACDQVLVKFSDHVADGCSCDCGADLRHEAAQHSPQERFAFAGRLWWPRRADRHKMWVRIYDLTDYR